MLREQAIQMCMEIKDYLTQGNPIWDKDKVGVALDIAIEALKRERTDEWCTDCKEYDTEKKCCPRFNRVIRGAMNREPSEDGTLEVKVEDATKVGRVLIADDKHRGGLYYPDEDEPKGDLISRAEAIDALGEEPPVWCDEDYEIAERSQWRDDVEAIKSVPSADRPSDEEDQLKFYYVESIDDYWIGMRIDNFYYADWHWHEGLGFVWSTSRYLPWGEHIVDENTLWKEHTYPSEPVEMPFTDWIVGFVKKYFADRPRGEWVDRSGGIEGAWNYCSVCEEPAIDLYDFCPNCGADMRGEDK